MYSMKKNCQKNKINQSFILYARYNYVSKQGCWYCNYLNQGFGSGSKVLKMNVDPDLDGDQAPKLDFLRCQSKKKVCHISPYIF